MRVPGFLMALIWICGLPSVAHAYVGPGLGLGGLAVTLAILLGVVLLVVGFLWYPLKRLLRGRRAAPTSPADPDRRD